MSQVRETLSHLSSELGESTMIQFYPVLRYTGIDLKTTCILSYILGWNVSGRPCYISKEKLSNAYQLTYGEIELSIAELLHRKLVKLTEIEFKNTKTRAFEGDMDTISEIILNNEDYLRITKIKKLSEELKNLQEGKPVTKLDKTKRSIGDLMKQLDSKKGRIKSQ